VESYDRKGNWKEGKFASYGQMEWNSVQMNLMITAAMKALSGTTPSHTLLSKIVWQSVWTEPLFPEMLFLLRLLCFCWFWCFWWWATEN
jgi:hypothetical protein